MLFARAQTCVQTMGVVPRACCQLRLPSQNWVSPSSLVTLPTIAMLAVPLTQDIQGLPLLERLTVALSGVVPDVLNTLPRLAHLDLSKSHGGMLTAGLPLLTQLTYLEAGWSQFEHPAAVLAACTRLAVFRARNGFQNRCNFASCAPAGRRVAGALRALRTLCQLEEVEVPMACMREPGVEEAHAALAELRAARPALCFTDAEFYGTDSEEEEKEEDGEVSQGEDG